MSHRLVRGAPCLFVQLVDTLSVAVPSLVTCSVPSSEDKFVVSTPSLVTPAHCHRDGRPLRPLWPRVPRPPQCRENGVEGEEPEKFHGPVEEEEPRSNYSIPTTSTSETLRLHHGKKVRRGKSEHLFIAQSHIPFPLLNRIEINNLSSLSGVFSPVIQSVL